MRMGVSADGDDRTVGTGRSRWGAGVSPDPLLAAVEAAVDALQASDPSQLASTALGDRIVGLEAMLARLAAHQVACVAVFDARGDAQATGARSSQAWLRQRTRLPR